MLSGPTQVVAGVPIPVSTRSFPNTRDAFYPLPAYDSLTWAGADWEYPTALTFQQETIHAEKIGFRVTLPEGARPADYALRSIQSAFREAANGALLLLASTQKVLEPSRPLTAEFAVGPFGPIIYFDALVWPRVEGVTVPAPDRTR